MLSRLFVTVLAASFALCLARYVRGLLLMPVPVAKNQRLMLVLTVFGDAPELEQTVRSLLWIVDSKALPMGLVIADAGMDSGARDVAERISKKERGVVLCRADEVRGALDL